MIYELKVTRQLLVYLRIRSLSITKMRIRSFFILCILEEFMCTLGERIKTLRENKQMTQQNLGDIVKLHVEV